MELRTIAICLACLILSTSGLVYGIAFIKKRNYLLGIEWMIVSFSAVNAFFYFAFTSEFSFVLSHFCDAFSRAVGIPVITVLGLMAVTNDYRPSALKESVIFVAAFAFTLLLVVFASMLHTMMAYYYMVMWGMFSVYLIYLSARLASVGETCHALGVLLVMVLSQTIACIYDFYKIPGDETNIVLNFYVLALCTWAFMLVQLYYAYCALERSKGAVGVAQLR